MEELEVTNCPHCGATIYGVGSISASGKYCKNCISDAVYNIPMTYVKENDKKADVIAFAVTGIPIAIYKDIAKNIFDSLEENDPDMLDDFIREYLNEKQEEYREWLLESF